ncbi:MAG: cytochrome D1 domain-containing protein [Exilibacterium sp.]
MPLFQDYRQGLVLLICYLLSACSSLSSSPRATGDLGLIIERASGKVQLIDTSSAKSYATIGNLGDLSHASVVYSRDQRYAYIFARDGGLSKVDLLTEKLIRRVVHSGNSIGGAISQDGKLIAVSNYEPGGVKVFRSDTLALVADIPATYFHDSRTDKTKSSKVVGLVDAPGNRFVFSLFDTDEIWILDFSQPTIENPYQLTKFTHVGRAPYDALITPDGRHYIAGLFGEDGMAMLDLWHPEQGVRRILPDYGRGGEKLPVYKMPHLEGWAVAGDLAFVPAIGQHQVLVVNTRTWKLQSKIDVYGQPVFVMARPDGRQVWVNFAFPDNGKVQVIDVDTLQIAKTLAPGPAVLHMEFTPRGESVWVSVRDANKVAVYDTRRLEQTASLAAASPSGIFFTSRAHQIGL